MNVSLTPEEEALIAAKVSSGRYGSSAEVIRAALRLLAEHDLSEEQPPTIMQRQAAQAIGRGSGR